MPPLILAGAGAFGQDQPRRIASLSLCTDELVLRLADKERVVSVSYLARDPEFSRMAGLSEDIYLNRGQAEEILSLAPDLILSSQFSATAAVNLLRRLGHEVRIIGFPVTLEQTYGQVREVAVLLGEPDRGEALITGMRRDMGATLAEIPPVETGKLAVFYASNGYSYGSGTLRHDFLASLGWRNLAAEAGLAGPGRLPLEVLLSYNPDYLLVDNLDFGGEALANHMLKHRAVARMFQDAEILELPDRFFQCAGPSLVDAYRHLARQLNGNGRR